MSVSLKATKREDLTRSHTRVLREDGKVPGVVYGKNKEAQTIAVDAIDLIKVIREQGKNGVLSLNIDAGQTVEVMFHDYQVDPLKDDLVHVDFYIVNMSEARDVSVPLRLEGESSKGVLQQPLFEVQVRAKPNDIPEEITVDVSALEIGESITISDIPITGNYEVLDDPETTVATVLAPAAEVSEEHADEVEEAEKAEDDQEKEE
ncbi:50S ribosomal protein L25/general stress protein Ctc [Oceanobacillus salinisoli]|uniref:50S ribosomal protein L25/general stress protein Ctc n=1 Tax=Oceanobacillus salinisoli TaxID=2678611 RepID=UPI0012E28C39|nr:50S ribosomal protein L25/general stress protein Ctc [Oceanobacillus salinisoli]